MMLKIRAVVVDYYLWKPTNEFFGENKDGSFAEPILRIFGTTDNGVKSCVHIHGVYPYIYVPCEGGESQDRYALLLGAALNEALKGSSKLGSSRCVRDVSLVSGTPLYGYHSQQKQFFKISFYNPYHVKQASELLLSGAILGKKFQPHEAHIPFVLQFMIDYNIYGMSFVTFSKIKYRRDPENTDLLKGVDESNILPCKYSKFTHCRLEADAQAFDILNKNTGKIVGLNPGLQAFREEERNRMRKLSGSPSASLPESPPRRPFCDSSSIEFIYKEKLLKKLEGIFPQVTKSAVQSDEVPDVRNLINEEILTQVTAGRNLGTESESEEERTEPDSVLGRNHVEDEEEELEDEAAEDLTQPLDLTEFSMLDPDADPRDRGSEESEKEFWNRMAKNIFQVDGPQDSCSESDRDSTGKNSTESSSLEREPESKMALVSSFETWNCASEQGPEANWTNNIMSLLGEDSTCLTPSSVCQSPQTFWSAYSPKVDFWLSQSQEPFVFSKSDSAASSHVHFTCQENDACDISMGTSVSDDSFPNFSPCDGKRSNTHDGLETSRPYELGENSTVSFLSTETTATATSEDFPDLNFISTSEIVDEAPKPFDHEDSRSSFREDFIKTKMVVLPRRLREPTEDGNSEGRIPDVFESFKVPKNNKSSCGENKRKMISLTLKQYIKDCEEIVNVDFKNLCDRDMVIIEYKSLQSKAGQSKFLIKPLEKFIELWKIAENKINESLAAKLEKGSDFRKSNAEENAGKDFPLRANVFQCEKSKDSMRLANTKSEENKFKVKSLEVLADHRKAFKVCDVNSYKINQNFDSQGNIKMKLIKSGQRTLKQDCFQSIPTNKILFGKSSNREKKKKLDIKITTPPDFSVTVEKKESLQSTTCLHKKSRAMLGKEKDKKGKTLTALDTKLIRQINSSFEKYFRNMVKVKNANFNDSSSSSLPSEDEEREDKKEERECWNRAPKAPVANKKHCNSFLDPGDFVTRVLAALSGTARGSSPMQPLSVTVTFGNPAGSISTPTQMNIEWGKSGPKKKRPKGKRRIQNVDGAADSSSEDSASEEPKERIASDRKKVKRDTFYKPLNIVLGGSSFRRKKRKHGLGKEEEGSGTLDSAQEDCFDVFRVTPGSPSCFRGSNKTSGNELTGPGNCSIISNRGRSGSHGNKIKLSGSDTECETDFIHNSSERECTASKFMEVEKKLTKTDVPSGFNCDSRASTLMNSFKFPLSVPKKDSEERKKNVYEEKNENKATSDQNLDLFAPNINPEEKGLLETEFEISKTALEWSGPLAKISQDVSSSDDKLSPASNEVVSFSTRNTSENFSSQTFASDCSFHFPRSQDEDQGSQKFLNWPKGARLEQCGRSSESVDGFSGMEFKSCEAEEALEFEKASSDSPLRPKLSQAPGVQPFAKSTDSATESTEVYDVLENSRIGNLTMGPATFFPKRSPPKKSEIFEFLKEKKIFFNEAIMPFFGDPTDHRDAIEMGPRVLKIRSDSIAVLKTHKNVLGTLGIEEKRHLRVNGTHDKNKRNLRFSLASRRICRIFPLRKPPTFAEVTAWLDSKRKLKKEKRSPEVSQSLKCVFEFDSDENSSVVAGSKLSIGSTQMDEAFTSSVDDDILGVLSTKSSNDTAPYVENVRECEVVYKKGPPNKIKGVKRFSRPKTLETILEGQEASEWDKKEGFCGRREGKPDSDSSFQIRGVTCDNTLGFSNSVEHLNLGHSFQYVSLLVMEVHVQTRKEMLPDPRIDPVRAWFYAVKFDDPERTQENGVIVVGENLLSGTSISKMSVHYVATEKALFEKAIELVRNWDPEILAGYEIELNSWGYFVQRGFVLDLNLLVMLGRVRSEFCIFKQPSGFSDDVEDADQVPKCVKDMRVSGRIVLDVWRVLRHEVALKSYTFESVMYHLSHERHPLLSYETLSFYWEHPSHRFRHITVTHYSTRVVGVIKLLDQLDFVNRNSELSRLFGIQFYEVLSRGSQYRVESMMLRLAKPLGYIPVSPSVAQRASMRAPASLPLIMEPESIFYSDPLIVLDFQSLYPSMIIAYNYCFSTCVGRVEKLGGREPFEFGCTQLQISPEEIKEFENDITISPAGVVFVKNNVRKGVLPTMLETILETRLMVKKSMKENKKDKVLQKLLFARQLGLKLIANVTYGYTAANFSGRMPCIEVGDSVVSKGRETLERAIKLIKTNSEWGAQVVYGDTDSIFVLTPGRTIKESFKIGEEIAAAVTQDNPKPVKLKLEKVYMPSILQTKKRYVGYMYESAEQNQPVFEAKGIETVRRDGCAATEKILRKALQILFDTKDVSLVKKYTLRQFAKIYQGKINLQDLIFAKEYRGRNGYRPGACVPALELAKQWTKRDPRAEPRTKERVPYIIANGPPGVPLIRLVRSPKDFAKDPGLRPNAEYYITKAIIPPLNRCLSLLGADVVSWYSEMPRKYHKILKTVQEEPPKRTTISQYFSAAECIACNQITNGLTCSSCRANPQKVAVCSGDKIRRLERRRAGILKICQSCCGRQTELSCISLDCPVMFRRNQIEKEANQISGLRGLLQVRE